MNYNKNKKVLFVHDGPVYTDSRGNYYGIHINDTIRKRYLNLGTSISFLIRVEKLKDKDLSFFTKIENDNFSVFPFPDFKSVRLFFKNFFKAKAIIRGVVKNHDIIICRLPSASGTNAVKFAIRDKKPVLVEYVACTFDSYWNYDWRGKLIAYYKMWQQKAIMKKVPFSIYVTREFLQKRYPTKGISISSSDVELQQLNESDLNQRILKIENTDFSGTIILGTVAALDVPYKGQADVIKAIAKLKKRNRIFHYYLVGQGSGKKLNNLAQKLGITDQVKIIGVLKHKLVFDFFNELDIYIQPSKQEGLPRAVIEAMSKACPVLGAKTAGIPELLDPEMIFKAGSRKEIIKKLLSINKDILLKQAKRNYEEAKSYQKDLLDEKRINFYKKFLSETARNS